MSAILDAVLPHLRACGLDPRVALSTPAHMRSAAISAALSERPQTSLREALELMAMAREFELRGRDLPMGSPEQQRLFAAAVHIEAAVVALLGGGAAP